MEDLIWKLLFSVMLISISSVHSMYVDPNANAGANIKLKSVKQYPFQNFLVIGAYPFLYRMGEPFILECKLTGFLSDIQYTWFKDGHLIDNGKALFFETLKVKDLGSYKCVASGNTVDGIPIELESPVFKHKSVSEDDDNGKNVEFPDSQNITESTDQQIITILSSPRQYQVGKHFTMQCRVRPELKDMKYSWLKDGHLIHDQQTLSFGNFRREDIGLYQCLVTGYSEEGFLIKLEASRSKFGKIGVINDELSNGMEVELNTSTIRKKSNIDMGQIETNSRSEKRQNIEPIFFKYNISIVLTPKIFRVGERLSMQCKVTPDIKDAQYTWSKNSRQIKYQETLIIDALKQEDLGSYKCVVEGTTVNKISVVLEAGIFIEHLEPNSRISNRSNDTAIKDFKIITASTVMSEFRFGLFQKVHIRCPISVNTGDTATNVAWYINGEELEYSPKIFRRYKVYRKDLNDASILSLYDVQIVNDAVYKCRVGKTVKLVKITVY